MIQYLDYKEDKIPFRVGYYALSRWQAETGKDLTALDEIDNDITLVEPLMWYAIEAGCKAEGKKNPFTKKDFAFSMDEIWDEFLGKMESFFQGAEEAKKRPQETLTARAQLTMRTPRKTQKK